MAKKQKVPFWEAVMWWCAVFGAVMTLISAIPSALPWRYARVDTNCGNRFVMERYYYMTGATNNIGKTEGWLNMRKKFQRKTEEFGRPSPLVALMGAVTSGIGAGGAAMGCAMWVVCKEHVSQRYMNYSSVAYTGMACMVGCFLSVLTAVASIVMLGFEQDAEGKKKKKKKKHDDDCMEPATKTMTCAISSFLFSSGSCTAFVCVLGNTLKDFKRTAYYPFAGSHAAPFVGGFGAFLLFISMLVAINRVFHCCGKKKTDDEFGEGEGYGGGGYGAPPGAYGAPPGAYGAPPGAYGAYGAPPGAYPPQQQW